MDERLRPYIQRNAHIDVAIQFPNAFTVKLRVIAYNPRSQMITGELVTPEGHRIGSGTQDASITLVRWLSDKPILILDNINFRGRS